MPLVDYGLAPRPDLLPALADTPDMPESDASTFEVVGAAFRQNNNISSLLASELRGVSQEPEDGFTGADVWKDIEGTQYEAYWEDFAEVRNRQHLAALKAQVDKEIEDRLTLAANPYLGFGASLLAGIVDPTILVPGVGAAGVGIRAGSTAYRLARGALAGSTAAVAGIAAQEGALHGSQVTRTLEESVSAIGMGALLGGVFGGAAGLLGPRAVGEATRAARELASNPNIDEMLPYGPPGDIVRGFGAAGADAVTRETIESLGLAGGRGTRKYADVTKLLSPTQRILASESATARQTVAELVETPVYVERNLEGRGTIAAETEIKQYALGWTSVATREFRKAFTEASKRGLGLNETQFAERVGRAMRRGDEASAPGVAEAARAIRKRVFDPLKDRLIAQGLLPEDVGVRTSTTYLHRMWNRTRLIAEENRFKQITRNWVRGSIGDIPLGRGKEFVSQGDLDAYIEEVVESVFNKLTGRAMDDTAEWLIPVTRGPLKERTFNIPDELVEDFLESDIRMVMRRYAQVAGTELALAKRFGKADMRDRLIEIGNEYAELRSKAQRDRALSPEQKQKRLEALTAEERAVMDALGDMRDILRNKFAAEHENTVTARTLRQARQFNFMRVLGEVLFSSIPDAGRTIMTQGLGRYYRHGLKPLMQNVRALKLSKREAELGGSAVEVIHNSRMATLAELSNPYASNSVAERFMDNMTSQFSRMTGLPWWNDFNKTLASSVIQARIIENSQKVARGGMESLSRRERAYMGYVGLDEARATDIARQFEKHGKIVDGVYLVNSEAWNNSALATDFLAAVTKDVDTTIVTKGLGDVPIWMNTPLGKTVGQFKTFLIASNNRMTVRMMQEMGMGRDAVIANMTGLMTMTAIGMLAYYLKTMSAGRDLTDNWGTWVAEGLDRSGLFAVLFEANNIWEKSYLPGAYHLAAGAGQMIDPDAEGYRTPSRFATRNVVGSYGGPTAELISRLYEAGGIPGRGDMTPGDIENLRRLMPFSTLPVIRSIIDNFVVPEAKEAVK